VSEGRKRQGFWLTAGEIVGVLALIIAGLNLWESHQQHVEESHRAETSAQAQAAFAQAQAAFVAIGTADRDGRHISIAPLKAAQAIQSQRYRFPRDLSDSVKEISAARPQIDAGWISEGLRTAIETAHVKGAGEGRTPVVIETTYIEDGDEHTDTSLYRLGYAWKPKLFGGQQIRLEGLALVKRGVSGDPQQLLDTRWEAERPKPR